ncbi:MAG: hypothetical protein JWP91_1410 [Fibrobacteres bacterium]|nr:hypothetical protein [Fibrobacterota bacterium]
MTQLPRDIRVSTQNPWPSLPLSEWRETRETLHMWTQIVGKVRLAQSPLINHWWEVPLYLTSRGMTTSPIPHHGATFQIDFDFISHNLQIQSSEGIERILYLSPMPVAEFYQWVMEALGELGLPVRIRTLPVEVENPIPFDEDYTHHSYDPEYAWRFWRSLVSIQQVFELFRSRFTGKCSPIHFFWGGFDLALSRYSGRPAPEHQPTPFTPASIVREAYSHEVSSCGFWPGGGIIDGAMFYAYAYPEPGGFKEHPVAPAGAYYNRELGEFLLPYESVRRSDDPEGTLLGFLQSTYEAAADLGGWDRKALERFDDAAFPATSP